MKAYIIVADDDADDRLLLQTALSEVKFPLQALFMKDGSEVISHLAVSDLLPQLVILDINMPRVTGIQVLEFIRSRRVYDNIPVHILSTSILQYDEKSCLELGAASYTTKPDSYRKLVDWLAFLKK